jgi:hypothetical protein
VRTNTEPLGHPDLVANQGEQRVDENRRTRAGLAEELRRDELDDALAPAGRLDEEVARAVVDEGLDRFELPGR